MKKKYVNINSLPSAMNKVLEEMGEVLQADSKAKAHGLDSYHPDDPNQMTNRLSLALELLDVIGAANMALGYLAPELTKEEITTYNVEAKNILEITSETAMYNELGKLGKMIYEYQLSKNFWHPHGVDIMMEASWITDLWITGQWTLIHSEVTEAFEGRRRDGKMDKNLPHRTAEEVGGADIIIRTLGLMKGLGYDAPNTIREKIAFNHTRPDHDRVGQPGEKQF